MKKLRAYMGYSNVSGPSEGAILIFAYTAKDAKKIGWNSPTFIVDYCDNDYTDFRINWLKNEPWLFDQMKKNEPHVIECPRTCKSCGLWGYEMNGDYCLDCYDEIREEG